jgi:phosphoribosylformimino-5-aminoimidazole carboxamide ribotide isomerase
MAGHWVNLGATRLHVVDLDGAAAGQVCHWDVIGEIAKQAGVPVQVGGGIRDLDTARRLIHLGVKRVILGTSAVEDPAFVAEACAELKEGVVVSVDARNGFASTRGWKTPTVVKAVELAIQVVELGAQRLIYTDIASDGTLGEPNYATIRELMERSGVPVIAAGGISCLEHLVELEKMGVEGAIVGRALYTGNIELRKALEVLHAG